MSSVVSQEPSKIITSPEDLKGYFQPFAKEQSRMQIGLEVEFFAVNTQSGMPLSFFGEPGIEVILRKIAAQFNYEEIREKGRTIALLNDRFSITLEPGGQVELSAPPVCNIFEIENQLQTFLDQLRWVRDRFDGQMQWLAAGIHPFANLSQVEWVPKERYKIMREYFKTHEPRSHEMMTRTATNQLNFDYVDEEDAMEKMRVAYGITTLVTGLFSNSAYSEGKLNGFKSKRLDIWNHTDPDRSGMLYAFLSEEARFSDYVNYILDMPMMFILRAGDLHPMNGMTFRKFISEGYQGTQATVNDFELHISGAFPEVRFKKYLEVRGADCQKPYLIPAVAAFWKGIFYDQSARQKAWNLVKGISPQEHAALRESVARDGLHIKLQSGRTGFEIARELIDISCASLGKQSLQSTVADECKILARIRKEILKPEKTPADQMIEAFKDGALTDPASVIDYLSIG